MYTVATTLPPLSSSSIITESMPYVAASCCLSIEPIWEATAHKEGARRTVTALGVATRARGPHGFQRKTSPH